MATRPVLQFKITLREIESPIWRRIQLSDLCSFWDLHVAIQDVMGWTDSHLHEFTVYNPVTTEREHIGIPHSEDGLYTVLEGWRLNVRDYVALPSNHIVFYLYDFGDNWEHLIEFEGKFEKQPNVKYPLCIDGERACPPEDVGGSSGYEHFVEAITTQRHPDRKDLLQWVGGKYDPNYFDPNKVKFDNPTKRWKNAFEREGAI